MRLEIYTRRQLYVVVRVVERVGHWKGLAAPAALPVADLVRVGKHEKSISIN